ncbi:hypothetical protein [Plantactinospora sp. GCM10030261]|uniref:hypothetical protein n=1 Tax=Plantactinospora sp. GCM10030261 TaxID=3273420 RepID=UPI003606D7C7
MPGAAWPSPQQGWPPQQGWQPQPGWSPQPGWPGPGWQSAYDWNDPLVNPPGAGVGGWFARSWAAARRSWRPLLPILLLTQIAPAIAVSLVAVPFEAEALAEPATAEVTTGDLRLMLGNLFVYYGVLLGGAVLAAVVQAIGWAAGFRVLAGQAAGQPVSVGDAFRYGVRRAPGLWAWSLLVGLIIAVGLCACVLPGFYLAFALSMTLPVYVFERRNPIGRSFGMVHTQFGMALGRIAIIVGLAVGCSLGVVVLQALGIAATGGSLTGPSTLTPGYVVVTVVATVFFLPAYLLVQVGLLTTYAELRGSEAPVTTTRLAGELG